MKINAKTEPPSQVSQLKKNDFKVNMIFALEQTTYGVEKEAENN